MRAVIQKVSKATLFSEGEEYSKINNGMLILLSVHENDTVAIADKMSQKLLNLRIFDDENGKTNLNIFDTNGEIMLVSNFTIYGNLKGTNRPDFFHSAKPDKAEPLYTHVYQSLAPKVGTVTGVFRTHMEIDARLDGPGTYIVEFE